VDDLLDSNSGTDATQTSLCTNRLLLSQWTLPTNESNVRQGLVTCRGLSIYRLSKDKLMASYWLGIYGMGTYEVVI